MRGEELHNGKLSETIAFGKNEWGGPSHRVIKTNVPGLYIEKMASGEGVFDSYGRHHIVTVWPKEWTVHYYKGCMEWDAHDKYESKCLFEGDLHECKNYAKGLLEKLKATAKAEGSNVAQ